MPAVSMHKKLPPAQWRDEITLWLESLTAAGLSQDTINQALQDRARGAMPRQITI